MSVVFVTYDSAAVISAALASVRAHLPGAELVVVDNGSTDTTVEVVRSANPDVIVCSDTNAGFGPAVNLGVSAATRPLIMVLNPDVRVADADAVALHALSLADTIGLLGGASADGARKIHPDWPWPVEVWWALSVWFLVPREVEIHRPRARRRQSRWIAGSSFLVLKKEFLEIGGFDERFFLYYEDVDLARRYSAARRVVSLSEAVYVIHMGRASSPRDETFLTVCAIMGLLQTTANWNGPAAARRAARLISFVLRLFERLGRLASRLPVVGPRARQKARFAEEIHRRLFSGGQHSHPEGSYPDAAKAITVSR